MYVDGGVISPVAVEAAKRLGADVVIAVDISWGLNVPRLKGRLRSSCKPSVSCIQKCGSIQLSQADVVIRPKVGHIDSADFSKKHEAILEGEKAAIEALPQIMAIITQLRQERNWSKHKLLNGKWKMGNRKWRRWEKGIFICNNRDRELAHEIKQQALILSS